MQGAAPPQPLRRRWRSPRHARARVRTRLTSSPFRPLRGLAVYDRTVTADDDPGGWQAHGRRLEALRRERNSHPGFLASVRWGGLRRTVDTHYRNTSDLIQLLEAPQRDPGL